MIFSETIRVCEEAGSGFVGLGVGCKSVLENAIEKIFTNSQHMILFG